MYCPGQPSGRGCPSKQSEWANGVRRLQRGTAPVEGISPTLASGGRGGTRRASIRRELAELSANDRAADRARGGDSYLRGMMEVAAFAGTLCTPAARGAGHLGACFEAEVASCASQRRPEAATVPTRTRSFAASARELGSASRFGCARRLRLASPSGAPAAPEPRWAAAQSSARVADEEEEEEEAGREGGGVAGQAGRRTSVKGLVLQGKLDEAAAQFERRRRAGQATGPQLTDLLGALLEAGRADEAAGLFGRCLQGDEGFPPPAPPLCTAFLDGMRRRKKAREAAAVLRRMREGEEGAGAVEFDAALYGAAVSVYRDLALDKESREEERRAWLREAERVVSEAAEAGALSEFVFQPLVHAYAHSGRFSEAVGALRRSVAAGVPPNASFFTALLSSCGRTEPADWEAGRAYWKAMRDLKVQPTVMAWTARLKLALACWEEAARDLAPALERAGLEATADGLARLFMAEMEAEGTPFNDFSYNTVVAHFVGAGDETRAREWVRRARDAKMASCFLFTVVLGPIAKAGDVLRAAAVEAAMAEEGVEPDAVFLCSMMECYQKAGDYGRMDATVRRVLEGADAGRCPIDSRVLATIFDQYGLFRKREAKERVEEVLAGVMAGRWGGRPLLDPHVMAKAIEALGRCRDPDATARHATGTLRELGLRPTAYVLKSVYQTHCNNSRLLDGLRVLEEILGDEALRPRRIDDRTWLLLLQRIEKWKSREEQRQGAALALRLLSPSAPKAAFDALRALAA
eukprot:tig00001127_g7148.t1